MANRINHRTYRRTEYKTSINWERIFYLIVFPMLCWYAILAGILAALYE